MMWGKYRNRWQTNKKPLIGYALWLKRAFLPRKGL